MTATFADFGLAAPLNRALEFAGFHTPTPIQAQAIPHLIQGRDMLGLAQTGTGKTAAFVLPILQGLRSAGSKPEPHTTRALILAPTRELAIQIHESVAILAKGQHFAHTCVFGGVSINPQIEALRRGLDILIATPGRLVDLIQQKQCKLSSVQYFVLDEADRMLDMGFIRDIKRILALLPTKRQSMLFSATMPETIGDIANKLLKDPITVEVRPEAVPMERIAQHLVHLPMQAKKDALLKLLSARDVTRAMVFARTKHGANRLSDYLEQYGLDAVVIHGNKSQGARQKALAQFKSGESKILVATDIAARGIDVADVSHVINAELPDEPEAYVHRIGRTARAGKVGISITLCSPDERDKLKAVEKLIRRAIPVMVIEGLDLAKAAAGGQRISEEREERGARRGRSGGRREEARGIGRRGEERGAPPPRADRPAGDRPASDRPASDRPAGDRPARPLREPRRDDRLRDDRPRSDAPRRDERSRDPAEQVTSYDAPWSNQPAAAAEPRRDERPRGDRGPRRDDRPRSDAPRRDDRPKVDRPAAAQPVRPGDASGFRDEPRAPRGDRADFLPRFLDNKGGDGAARPPRPQGARPPRSGGGGRRFG
ncbi:MAG: DEAD/DEAH box helicase [Bosea sp. (in: a-proteobacteria)]